LSGRWGCGPWAESCSWASEPTAKQADSDLGRCRDTESAPYTKRCWGIRIRSPFFHIFPPRRAMAQNGVFLAFFNTFRDLQPAKAPKGLVQKVVSGQEPCRAQLSLLGRGHQVRYRGLSMARGRFCLAQPPSPHTHSQVPSDLP
jgi:hypothetical protein